MTRQITSGRGKRMLKVGTLTTQVGGAYLLQSLLKPFRSANAHEREMLDTHVRNAMLIVERSKELRGAFTKLVQMLSMRDDLLPTEALDVLATVQSSVPPMSYTQIREVVRAELGKPPEKLFANFEREAFAAASLGQVHAAETRDGRPVVVKIQYPGVDETVEQDLKNVDALLQVIGRIARDVLGKAADVASLRDELEERLREELDYRREAANLARFRELFADDEEIELPEVDPELSTRRVLTMTRLEGYPLADILAPGIDQELKDWVAQKYYRLVWRQLLRFGCLHTDPHPGNYRVTHHPHLGMLDFGSVRVFPESVRRAYVALARAVLDRDRPGMIAAGRELGFLAAGDPEKPLVEVLEIVLEPILLDRDYAPAEYRTIDKAMRVANLVVEHRLFQSPGHRVFLMRALIGLESLIKQLGTVANWRRLLEEELPPQGVGRSPG